jgi:UDP-N-acetyl-D-galactosamine dehydrogenase
LQRDHEQRVVELGAAKYDLVIGAVAHAQYRALSSDELHALVNEGGILADLRGMWRDRQLNSSVVRWSL